MLTALAQTTATVPQLTGTEVLVGIAAIAFFAWLGNSASSSYSDADCERFADEACTYLYEQECVRGELIDLRPYLEKQP